MAALTDILNRNDTFLSLPREQKDIYARLASVFEDREECLYLSPTELVKTTALGNPVLWQNFLQLEAVQAYIKGQMASLATVAQRKAFSALTRQANTGDVQAAKQINEISGVLNQDNNKIIILHRIDRPTTEAK